MDNRSIWQICTPRPPEIPSPSLSDRHVAIIGGGLCGLLCAYRLFEAGVRDICILEAGCVGGGTTSYTTAKITAQHGILYSEITRSLGVAAAQQYASANLEALSQYEQLIRLHHIDCAFRRQDAWLYASDDKTAGALAREAKAARECGIPSEFGRLCPLPIPVRAALRFPDQAEFSPLAFIHGLSGVLLSHDVAIHEHTRALQIGGGTIRTSRGSFRAKHIIIATRYPTFDLHGLYFLRLYQSRSYLMALEGAEVPDGMFLDAGQKGFTFRGASCGAFGNVLLFGGGNHRTGTEGQKKHYEQLTRDAMALYPNARIVAAWSAQDCMTHDGIPYIGRLTPSAAGVYVAAGFNKWGMTSSMVAAGVLTELIVRGRSRYRVFSPRRFDPGLSGASFLKNLPISGGGIAEGLFAPPSADGTLLRCTHMGGILKWNADEGTWDCKSHGSRFRMNGSVEEGPALRALKRTGKGRVKRSSGADAKNRRA